MLFWIVAAAMTAAVVMLIVWPLARPAGAAGSRAAYDLEVYRDQLKELERERDSGLISAAQADAARAEVGRRMLALESAVAKQADAPAVTGRTRIVAVLLALVIPAGALAVYMPLGRPDQPAQPLASRTLPRNDGVPAEVLAAVDKLKQTLAEQPDNIDGWILLGRTYTRMNRYDDAAEAFRQARRIDPKDPDVAAAFGDVAVNSNNGIVSEEARGAFEAALAARPDDPRAQFYLALARFQAGDVRGALDQWRGQMAHTPADAPWLPMLKAQITRAAESLNLNVAEVMPQPLPPRQAAAPAATPDAKPAGQADDLQRNEMVRSMVASLAEKQKANPGDVDGWLRLARSYSVLKEPAKALDAARQAAAHGPARADAQLTLAQTLIDAANLPGDKPSPLPAEAVTALKAALAAEPANPDALWLLGLDAAGAGRKDEAVGLWNKLLTQLDPQGQDHAFVAARIKALQAGG
ncbi:cytochrome c-type biogenesis protein CcmH [Azospirillum fermentarium]|uniref:c-type cytochrome biogenesis protein CcmI n=1 Tax=Azospirillum fermentarium TaxID=1233114 RepID=UPI0022272A67|nr:c-type cytochrome biogenesis protein CcmI [Azospirillum fermentarium]MCW2244523.1 cytochrome c-type biogenesis protein CcmH [Azospirillum fermentarium]